MKKLFAILSMILCFTLSFSIVACGGDGSDPEKPSTGKSVTKIEMATSPSDVDLNVGDTFSPEGGSIKVTYDDGSTEVISLTAEGVTLSSVNTNKVGKKTVTVTYEGKKTTFKVEVNESMLLVTFNYNYAGSTNSTQEVYEGDKLAKPANPTRTGYTFYNWYTDADCMFLYDFNEKVAEDITLYAEWKQDGKNYNKITYDLGYYGCVPQTFEKIVENGTNAILPTKTFERAEYTFDGWYVGENKLTEQTAINSDVTAVAKWTKTKTGTSTYTFEAELTDLTGKVGPGLSGTAQEKSMIVEGNATASGDKYISYLYKNGLALEFYIASSEKVTNATITVRVAAEMENINFDSSEYQVIVNGTPLSYNSVSLTSDKTFSDAIVISGVTLNEGANSIILKTNNNKRPMGDASTYEATAPMVDCIKITTSAVLIWDANEGLPMAY